MFEQSQNIADDRVDVDRGALGARGAALPCQVQQAIDDLRRPERLPFDLLE
jgi:hypothetical protein